MEAIQTTMILPARDMKPESSLGSLVGGKNADLILLDGNPLEDIRNIRKVSLGLKNGQIYDPAALHKMAGFE